MSNFVAHTSDGGLKIEHALMHPSALEGRPRNIGAQYLEESLEVVMGDAEWD